MSDTSAVLPFGQRLAAAMRERGPVCVGIDPHPQLLEAWGLPDSPGGVRAMTDAVVAGVAGHVAAVKPQAALFERFGSLGVAELEYAIAACRSAGVLCIVDAKRGDIGSTMQGYADAFLKEGSPLAGDAVTLSPYLGFGSLQPAIDVAVENNRGVFVLCLTSNPEGASVQHAVREGVSVAADIARHASQINAQALGGVPQSGDIGPVGLVVGATIGRAVSQTGTDLRAVHGAFLAPGVGAQGAGPAELATVFHGTLPNVLASTSRGILRKGPDVDAITEAAKQAVEESRTALGYLAHQTRTGKTTG